MGNRVVFLTVCGGELQRHDIPVCRVTTGVRKGRMDKELHGKCSVALCDVHCGHDARHHALVMPLRPSCPLARCARPEAPAT